MLPNDGPNLLQAIYSCDNNVFQHPRPDHASNFPSQSSSSSNAMTSSFQQNHIQQQNVFQSQNFQSNPALIQQQQQSAVMKNYAQNSAHMDAFSQASASSQMSSSPNFMNQGTNQYFENQMSVDQIFMQNVTNFQSTSNSGNLMFQGQTNNALDWSTTSSVSQAMGQITSRIDPVRQTDFTSSPNASMISANDSLSSQTKSPLLSSTSASFQQQQQQHNHQFSQASQNHMVQNILANPHPTISQNIEGQKVVPRNNEYLQQQQQQRPSPAQASTAPETSQINMQNQNKFVQKSSNNSSSSSSVTGAHQPHTPNTPKQQQQQPTSSSFTHNTSPHATNNLMNPTLPRTNMLAALKNSSTLIQSSTSATQNDANPKQQKPNDVQTTAAATKPQVTTIPIEDISKIQLKPVVIKLDKIPDEDQSLMQTDLKSFIQKDPQKAAKYGVAGPNNDTLFTKMKEDEARLPYKRKLPTNNIRPEDVGKCDFLYFLLLNTIYMPNFLLHLSYFPENRKKIKINKK